MTENSAPENGSNPGGNFVANYLITGRGVAVLCTLLALSLIGNGYQHYSSPAQEEASADKKIQLVSNEQPVSESEATEEVSTVDETPATETPNVTVNINLQADYTRLASYDVTGGRDGVPELVTALANTSGTAHEVQLAKNAGDHLTITLQRPNKPDQTIVRVSVSAEKVEVGFKQDPSDQDLKSTQDALVASKDALGVDVTNATWEGSGPNRSLLIQ